jgi:hypothetical protein
VKFTKLSLGAVVAILLLAAVSLTPVVAHQYTALHPTQARVIVPTYPPAAVDNGIEINTINGQAQVKYAPISVVTGSHTTVVAGVAGKKIRIIGMTLNNVVANGTAVWESSTSNTVITGAYSLAANGTISFPNDKYGYGETAAGDSLLMTVTGSSNTISGNLEYIVY